MLNMFTTSLMYPKFSKINNKIQNVFIILQNRSFMTIQIYLIKH